MLSARCCRLLPTTIVHHPDRHVAIIRAVQYKQNLLSRAYTDREGLPCLSACADRQGSLQSVQGGSPVTDRERRRRLRPAYRPGQISPDEQPAQTRYRNAHVRQLVAPNSQQTRRRAYLRSCA